MDKSIKVELPHMNSKALTIDFKRTTNVTYFLMGITAFVIIVFIALVINYFLNNPGRSENAVVVSTVTPTPAQTSTNPLDPAKPYYGVNVDMSQLVPGSNNYYKNSKGQDYIDIAHSLGINLFRIDNNTRGFNNGSTYATYTQDQWNEVLNKMNQDGIKAIILLEANSNDPNLYSSEINNSYITFLKQYVIDSNVGSNSDVIGIDLKNEPTLDTNNLSYLSQAKTIIKQKYPQMPLCVGGWRVDNGKKDANGNVEYNYNVPSDASKLNSIVDFYCVHMYGFDKQNALGQYPNPTSFAENFLEQTALVTNNKPILVEEFGASSGTTITDQQTLGSMQLQANAYSGVYQAIKNEENSLHVIGSTAYLFSPRTSAQDSWSMMSKDGNYLNPAAYVLQKYATGSTSNAAANLSSTVLPNPHIFKNADNGKTETVNVGDPVGFILNLPTNKRYTAVVSSTSLANITQPITAASGAYNVVFQAEKPGNVVFTIYNNPSCTAGEVSCFKNVVYIMNINIQ